MKQEPTEATRRRPGNAAGIPRLKVGEDVNIVTHRVQVSAIRMAGCGHTVYLSDDHERARRRDHEMFYCTVCGQHNYFPGKSDIEALRGQLATTKDMLDTARADRDAKERQRRAEKAAKTRIKNRIAQGVCPCCQRTFSDLARHMAGQHPDFVAGD